MRPLERVVRFGTLQVKHPLLDPAHFGLPSVLKNSPKTFELNAQIEVLHALFASTPSVMRQRDYALRFLALLSCFIQLALSDWN